MGELISNRRLGALRRHGWVTNKDAIFTAAQLGALKARDEVIVDGAVSNQIWRPVEDNLKVIGQRAHIPEYENPFYRDPSGMWILVETGGPNTEEWHRCWCYPHHIVAWKPKR